MALLATLVVLLGLAVAVDRVAVAATERGLVSDLRSGPIEVAADAEARIAGFPFLTQLALGRLNEVTLTASTASLDGLTVTDVVAVADGVGTSAPYPARSAALTATVPLATVHEAIDRSPLGEEGLDVEVRVAGRDVVAATTFLGLPVEATLRPTPSGRGIGLTVRSASLAGVTIPVDEMPLRLRRALADLRIPLDSLPEGLEVSEIQVLPEGIRLTAQGAELDLGSLRP
jgi:hypothetical protein